MPIAALVVGVCSLLAAIIGGALGVSNIIVSVILLVVAIIGGIVGIILSAISMKKFPEKKGMGVGGLVTSIIGLIYGVFSLVACVACIALGTAAIKEGYDSLTPEEKQQIEQGINQAVNEINNSANVTEVQ